MYELSFAFVLSFILINILYHFLSNSIRFFILKWKLNFACLYSQFKMSCLQTTIEIQLNMLTQKGKTIVAGGLKFLIKFFLGI